MNPTEMEQVYADFEDNLIVILAQKKILRPVIRMEAIILHLLQNDLEP